MMHRETSPGAARRECQTRPILVTAEDEREFQAAMEQYKQRSGRQFPTLTEVLEVLRSIGYAKRIWRPVGVWSPLPPPAIGEGPGLDDQGGLVGWFSTVETPVGP